MIDIFYETLKIATIDETDGPRLLYDPAWRTRPAAFPVSLSMPLGDAPVEAARLLPWLANLLPEIHLSAIGQALGVSPQDILGLLAHIGRDTAGALSIGAPRPAGTDAFHPIDTAADLARILDELPRRPFLVGEKGVSMSLAGAQDKLPVGLLDDGRLAVPIDGTPSTHILKPDNRHLPASVQNEALCLTLARLAGLDAATATTGRAGPRSYLLVERYDRLRTGPRITRIHQEDFCQLLGLFPSQKYEHSAIGSRHGPGLADLFAAAASFVSPGARLVMLDAVIFNAMTCNVDAHAKNFSILIGAGGTRKMAPLYDLMCGAAYRQITRQLPQAIAGRTDGADLNGRDWQSLARTVGLSPARTLRRVEEIATAVQATLPEARAAVEAMPAGGHPRLADIERAIDKRCRRLLRQLRTRDTPLGAAAADTR